VKIYSFTVGFGAVVVFVNKFIVSYREGGNCMKVVNIVTQMEAGGAQQAAMNITDVLRKKGYDAEIWFLYMKRPTYQGCRGVRVILNQRPTWIIDYVRILWGLFVLLIKQKPAVVITHTYYANVLGQTAARLTGVRARLAVQHNPAPTYPRLARWLDYWLGSMFFYTSNIAVSAAAYHSFDNYPARYRERLSIIHNGIPAPPLTLNRDNARRRFGLPLKGPLIVNVGRLASQKNQRLLIKLLKNLPGVQLAIAGDGELRNVLEDEARNLGVADRVFMLGEIAPWDIGDFLLTGDVFVFPSHYEALPFALVEAMAVGLPIIASDIGALKDVLGENESAPAGILIHPGNESGFAQAVKSVLEDGSLASSLADCSRARAKIFSLAQMVDSYEQCFGGFTHEAG